MGPVTLRKRGSNGAASNGSPSRRLYDLEMHHRGRIKALEADDTIPKAGKARLINQEKESYRRNFISLRQQLLQEFDEREQELVRQVDPPIDDSTLARMNLLAPTYTSRWERAPGNLEADAEKFMRDGDYAALELVKGSVGLIPDNARRQDLARQVAERQRELWPDSRVEAAGELIDLQDKRDNFEIGSAMLRGQLDIRTAPVSADQVSSGEE